MEDSPRLLIVDDDPEIRSLLVDFFRQHAFQVASAADGAQLDAELERNTPQLLVLDLMLPGEDGLSICRRLRSRYPTLPIIMLTAVSEDTDRIIGLEMGADDYLAKPFNPRELLARVKAVLRRSDSTLTTSGKHLRFEGWHLDLGRRELKRVDGTLVPLSSGEFDLLQALAEHPQQVMSRDELLDCTRGRCAGPYDRSIDVQLSRLRRKIEVDSKSPQIIKTIRTGGYLFSLPVEVS